jgi:gamma-glutamylcyclotransferase (GGCT)/AIG2-like uncharacterized protein YtfP
MPLAEYDSLDPQARLYVRVIRSVTHRDGSTIHAWVYAYNRKRSGLPVVASGDWRTEVTATRRAEPGR